MAGINKQPNHPGVPAPVIHNNPAPPVHVQDSGNVVDPAAAEAAAAAAAARKKKKKEKKKAAISLFEFPGDEETPPKKNNKSKAEKDKKKKNDKKKGNNKKPSTPKPAQEPIVPVVPAPPVVDKPQHDWSIPQGQDVIGDNVEGVGAEPIGDSEGDHALMDDEDGEHLVDETTIPQGSNGNNDRLHNQDSNATPGGARTKPLQPPTPHVNPAIWEERKDRVKDAFLHSWGAYKRDAWGKDEYHPITKYGSNMIRKGQGFTIVDSLDTILLMGLEKEFQEAKEWVRDELDFDQDGEVNLFETTIRVLGGLLSAYDQSKNDPIFLRKAVDLADRLMGAFETPTGIPFASVHLRDRRGIPGHDRGISSTAEVASLQLEFKYLSYLTGNDRYWKAVENVVLKIKEMDSLDGLVPIFINPNTGNFQGGEIRLGSRGDSYYGTFFLLDIIRFM